MAVMTPETGRSTPARAAPASGQMTRTLTLLFAVAAGAAVGNLYYAQPLLDVIGRSLGVSISTAGLLITATQVGYAVGIVLIVPLGDVRNRRRLVPVMMMASAVSLGLCAAAPDFAVLALGLAAVGVTTVSGQILTPFAGDLADDKSRGRILGIVVSGLLTGILGARILGGLIGGTAGWRSVFAIAAGIMVVLAGLIWRMTPEVPAKMAAPYGSLLRSVIQLVRREAALRVIMALGIVSMATFTLFWTALTFLLSDRFYHYPPTIIGLFGLAGLIGALAAQWAGRLYDKGYARLGTGVSWLLAVAAWGCSELGRTSLGWLLAGIVILDIATQAQRILNQTQAFAISVEARSRVNTAYVGGNFVGAALGSLTASLLWSAGGWTSIAVAGGGLSLLALILWAVTPRTLGQLERSPLNGDINQLCSAAPIASAPRTSAASPARPRSST
jgi:predicted MFS family arabinose efflux permease